MELAGSFSRGRVAPHHNNRVPPKTEKDLEKIPKNVDPSRIQDNVTLIDLVKEKSLDEVVNELMQPYIDEYNSKQKRNDRKIQTPYAEYWRNNPKFNKGQLTYEFVMQVGEHETFGKEYYNATGEDKLTKKYLFEEIYKEGLEKFQKAFPHLKVVQAIIHFDEPDGTPHLHIEVVPIGENYKQGLSHNVSIGNALGCDGIERVQERGAEGGFQLKRAYEKIHHEIVNNLIKEYYPSCEIKTEIHGLKHQDQRTWFQNKEENNLKQYKDTQNELKMAQNELKTTQAKVNILENKKDEIWGNIVEKVKGVINEFATQVQRQLKLEKRVPPIKKERVFGKANQIQEKFWSEIPSTYSKIGRVDAPEDDLRSILEEYDKELTKIENVQNEPISNVFEETIDDLEL